MSRRQYVQIDGVLYERDADHMPQSRDTAAANALLWNDRAYQDMGDPRFASRSQHQQYMKENNLTTIDDFKDTWRIAEANRIKAKAGYDPSRKEDIAGAIRQLNSRRRK